MGQNKRKNSNFESLKIAIFLSIFKHCEGRMKMLFFASSFLFDFCMTWNFFGNFVVVIFCHVSNFCHYHDHDIDMAISYFFNALE